MHCGGGIKIIGEWHKTPKILAAVDSKEHRINSPMITKLDISELPP
jgi:hypothetical protein